MIISSKRLSVNCPRSDGQPETTMEVAQSVTQKRQAALQRARRFRRHVLQHLWAPTHIQPCEGPGKCPWCPPGEVCECKGDGLPCACERRIYKALTEEGEPAFGVLSPMAASLILDTQRAAATRDPRAMELRVRLFEVLLKDMRAQEALEYQARRLRLEEARSKRKGKGLAGVIEGVRSKKHTGSDPGGSRDRASESLGSNHEGDTQSGVAGNVESQEGQGQA